MTINRNLLGAAALAIAAAGALLATSTSDAYAELICDGRASLCAESTSCLPIVTGYRCTTTYVYYNTATEP